MSTQTHSTLQPIEINNLQSCSESRSRAPSFSAPTRSQVQKQRSRAPSVNSHAPILAERKRVPSITSKPQPLVKSQSRASSVSPPSDVIASPSSAAPETVLDDKKQLPQFSTTLQFNPDNLEIIERVDSRKEADVIRDDILEKNNVTTVSKKDVKKDETKTGGVMKLKVRSGEAPVKVSSSMIDCIIGIPN
jgi:hypothetical protein